MPSNHGVKRLKAPDLRAAAGSCRWLTPGEGFETEMSFSFIQEVCLRLHSRRVGSQQNTLTHHHIQSQQLAAKTQCKQKVERLSGRQIFTTWLSKRMKDNGIENIKRATLPSIKGIFNLVFRLLSMGVCDFTKALRNISTNGWWDLRRLFTTCYVFYQCWKYIYSSIVLQYYFDILTYSHFRLHILLL